MENLTDTSWLLQCVSAYTLNLIEDEMDAKATLQSYEQVEFSITMTAPVTDWRAMLSQIQKLNGNNYSCAWPLSGFKAAISKMLDNLDKTHEGTITNQTTGMGEP